MLAFRGVTIMIHSSYFIHSENGGTFGMGEKKKHIHLISRGYSLGISWVYPHVKVSSGRVKQLGYHLKGYHQVPYDSYC